MEKQNQRVAELENNIQFLKTEICEMRAVLPRIKQYVTRRRIGNFIRQYQSDIQSMKKEIFEIKF